MTNHPTDTKDGGAAFACAAENGHQPGMSLRDWFAGQALAGLLAGSPDSDCGLTGYANDAYAYANAMLAERNKPFLEEVAETNERLSKSLTDIQLRLVRARTANNIDLLVDRFLAWPLPDSVCSDLCATEMGYPHRSGTNLLTATEARQMLEHLLAPPSKQEVAGPGEDGESR